MARIGITRHVHLTPASSRPIYEAIVTALDPYRPDLVGLSCIARGADSIFAQAVLDLGGRLEVVVPAMDYRATQVGPEHAPHFDSFLRRATLVREMRFATSGQDAYEAANHALLAASERLFAVWDGRPDVGRGNTASVVARARSAGLPVEVLWPAGAARAVAISSSGAS